MLEMDAIESRRKHSDYVERCTLSCDKLLRIILVTDDIELHTEVLERGRDMIGGDKENDQRNDLGRPIKEYLQLGYSEEIVSLDWKSLKWIFTIFVYLLVLSSVCTVRINVEECPVTETAWKTRSQIFKCIRGEVYHCIQDDNETLMEICMVAYLIKPPYEGGCPWASYYTDGECILGGIFHSCKGIGCPQNKDPDYWTNELYKYPKCLQHYDKTTNAMKSTEAVLDVIDTATNYDAKHLVSVLTAVVAGLSVGLLALVIVVVVFVSRWHKKNSRDKSNNSSRMPGIELDVGHRLI